MVGAEYDPGGSGGEGCDGEGVGEEEGGWGSGEGMMGFVFIFWGGRGWKRAVFVTFGFSVGEAACFLAG